MDFPKQAAFRRLYRTVRMGRTQGARRFGDRRAVVAEEREECLDLARIAAGDPVPPFFRIAKSLLLDAIPAVCTFDRCTDGRRIRLPHQFADQLFLSPQRAVGTHRFRGNDGVEQPLFQTDFTELIVIEFDQALTERL